MKDRKILDEMLRRQDLTSAYQFLQSKDLSAKSDAEYLLQRARLAANFYQVEQAIHDISQLKKYFVRDVRPLSIELQLYLNLRDYDSAKKFLKDTPRYFMASRDSIDLILRYYYEVGRYERVTGWWHSNTELKGVKNKKPVVDYIAGALVATGHYVEACELLKRQSKLSVEYEPLIEGLSLSKDINENKSNGCRGTAATRIGFVTPIGPGHEALEEECRRAVSEIDVIASGGLFEIKHYIVDDTQATLGRSKARNLGIDDAISDGIDWIFFIDADDTVDPRLLSLAAPYMQDYDFIWGGIYSGSEGGPFHYRLNQIPFINSIEQILNNDAFLTVQMGHFARVSLLKEFGLRFDESLDAGEDFKFYLDEALVGNVLKIPDPFFYNVRGRHSLGKRSATGGDWNRATARVLSEYRQKHSSLAER